MTAHDSLSLQEILETIINEYDSHKPESQLVAEAKAAILKLIEGYVPEEQDESKGSEIWRGGVNWCRTQMLKNLKELA